LDAALSTIAIRPATPGECEALSDLALRSKMGHQYDAIKRATPAT
jgi:hypothetical protein